MDDYLAEYMGSSLLDDTYDDLNVKIPKSVPKDLGHKPLAKNYPHTARPLSEPRRHRILPSKHNGTNNQINHEYKYEPDHTEPIDRMDQDTDSTCEQMDRDNKLSESELDTTSDDNDWCPVTKRRRRSDSVPENTSDFAKSYSSSEHAGTVQDLVNYVNDKVRLPCKYPIIPRTQHQMGLLTRTMWWSRVEAYEMLPAVDIEDEWTVIDECGGEDDSYEVVIIQEGYSVPH
uniref:Uncharacterized protein n=1 Tax=Magallana gigas TaxID=29159 RepID=K1RJU8_MAGGI